MSATPAPAWPVRNRVLRVIGALQIIAATALGIALLASANGYVRAVSPILPSVAESMSATAEVLTQVVGNIRENQNVLDRSIAALDSYSELVKQSKASAAQVTNLIPAWSRTAADVVARTRQASAIMRSTAQRMEFSVPTGIEFEGVQPRIKMTAPLRAEAADLRDLAAQTRELSRNLEDSWSAFTTNTAALSRDFAQTCDDTIRLLGATKEALVKIRSHDLEPALARLTRTSAQVNEIAQHVHTAAPFINSLFYLGLALVGCVGISGLSTLLLSRGFPE